jgi:hypothetical protein
MRFSVFAVLSALASTANLDQRVARLERTLSSKVGTSYHADSANGHKDAQQNLQEHKAQVREMKRKITLQAADVNHGTSSTDYETMYQETQARLTALQQHCTACQDADAVLETVLAYGVANHTLAQAAAATLAADSTALNNANLNRSSQISEYTTLKNRLTNNPIMWTASQELHQVVVSQAQALKAQSLVAIDADSTQVMAVATRDRAQANYTALADNAVAADNAVTAAQASRNTACSALTLAPSAIAPSAPGRA